MCLWVRSSQGEQKRLLGGFYMKQDVMVLVCVMQMRLRSAAKGGAAFQRKSEM